MDRANCTPTACNVYLILYVAGVSPAEGACRESDPIRRNPANHRIVIWMLTTQQPLSSRSILRSVSTVPTTFLATNV